MGDRHLPVLAPKTDVVDFDVEERARRVRAWRVWRACGRANERMNKRTN
jgi:hypothetical protein